jgi:hypothetical protein
MAGGCFLAVLRIEMGSFASKTQRDNPLNQATLSSTPIFGILKLKGERNYQFFPDDVTKPPAIKINEINFIKDEIPPSRNALNLLMANFDLPVTLKIESHSRYFAEPLDEDDEHTPSIRATVVGIPPINPTPEDILSLNQTVLLRGTIAIQETDDGFQVTLSHKDRSYVLKTDTYPQVIRTNPVSGNRDSAEKAVPNSGPNSLAIDGDRVIVPCTVGEDGYLESPRIMVVEYSSPNSSQQLAELGQNPADKIRNILNQPLTTKSAQHFSKVMSEVDKFHPSQRYDLLVTTMAVLTETMSKHIAALGERELSDQPIDIFNAFVELTDITNSSISKLLQYFGKVSPETLESARTEAAEVKQSIQTVINILESPSSFNLNEINPAENTNIAGEIREQFLTSLRRASFNFAFFVE